MAGYIGMYLFGDDRGNDGVNSIYLGILEIGRAHV